MSSTVRNASFPSPQRAADEKQQDRIVALASEGGAVRDLQKFSCLFLRQPVAEAGSLLPDVGDVGEVGGLLGGEHAVLSGFVHQLSNCRQADVDGGRREAFH